MNIASGLVQMLLPIVAEGVGNLAKRAIKTIGDSACQKIRTIGDTLPAKASSTILKTFGGRFNR